LTFR